MPTHFCMSEDGTDKPEPSPKEIEELYCMPCNVAENEPDVSSDEADGEPKESSGIDRVYEGSLEQRFFFNPEKP